MPFIHYDLCTGCGACAEIYPQFFQMRDGAAWFINHEKFVLKEHANVVDSCPFRAISIE